MMGFENEKKAFDCVEMKREIQGKILQEFAGLTPEEQQELTRKRIEADPVLGPLWRRSQTDSNPPADGPSDQHSR